LFTYLNLPNEGSLAEAYHDQACNLYPRECQTNQEGHYLRNKHSAPDVSKSLVKGRTHGSPGQCASFSLIKTPCIKAGSL